MTLPCDTVELPFNGPLYDEVLGITNDTLQPGQSYRKNLWERTSIERNPRYYEQNPESQTYNIPQYNEQRSTRDIRQMHCKPTRIKVRKF